MGDILLLKYPSVCSVYKAEGRFSVFINQGFLRFSLMPRVPESLPALEADMDTLAGMSYQETAYEVMRQFLTDFTEEELKDCIAKAYDEKFDTKEIAPLVKR